MKTSMKRILALMCVVAMGVTSMASCRKNPSSGGDTSSDLWEYESDYEEVNGDTGSTADDSSSEDATSSTGTQSSNNSSKKNNSSKNNSSNTSNGQSSGSDKLSSDELAAKYKGTTVKFATWEPHTTNESAKVLKDFTKKYGINVQIMNTPQSGYINTVAGKIAVGEGPDIIIDNGEFPSSLNILQPITVSDTINLADDIWDQGFIKQATFNGKVYEVNTMCNNWALYGLFFYNKTLFKNAGMTTTPETLYNAGKWNWDTMETLIKQYTNKMGKGNYGLQVGTDYDITGKIGTGFLVYKNGKVSCDIGNSLLTNSLTRMAQWMTDGYATHAASAFVDRKAAMCFGSTWSLKKTGSFKDMANQAEIGVTYLPDYDASHKAHAVSFWRGWGIAKKAKNPGGAGLFLRYFLDGNNYDSNIFISNEVRTLFYELTSNVDYTNQVFEVTGGCADLTNMGFDKFWGTFMTITSHIAPKDIQSNLDGMKPVMNSVADKANKLIADATK